MSITHSLTRKWSRTGETITKTESVSADGENNRDVSLTAGQSGLRVEWASELALMKSFYAASNRDVIIEAFDSGDLSVGDISISAGGAFMWSEASGEDNPFSDDVAYLEVTNSDSDDSAVVQIRSLVDATPTTS